MRIAGGLLLLIPLGWLCMLVYRRINPPRELPANEKAWIAFDRVIDQSDTTGITYERALQVAQALRIYLQIESVPLEEVDGALEKFFSNDQDKGIEMARVAKEALAILDRALYERPEDQNVVALKRQDARDLFVRIERIVPRP
jgi:hypothetical protein